jgi:hypothetical protein
MLSKGRMPDTGWTSVKGQLQIDIINGGIYPNITARDRYKPMAVRIKTLITGMIGQHLLGFAEHSTKRKGYWFRCDNHRPYYEFVVIGSSQKERVLSCDVAWGFFSVWDGTYGSHQMTASTGLANLRLGSRAIPMEESYYMHDGTEEGIQRTLHRIGCELVTHALSWFRSRGEQAACDPLLQHGLAWLRENERSIPATIQEDLREALVRAGHLRWRVEMPLFDALKSELRKFASRIGASPAIRKETAVLAHHLLMYAGEAKPSAS